MHTPQRHTDISPDLGHALQKFPNLSVRLELLLRAPGRGGECGGWEGEEGWVVLVLVAGGKVSE